MRWRAFGLTAVGPEALHRRFFACQSAFFVLTFRSRDVEGSHRGQKGGWGDWTRQERASRGAVGSRSLNIDLQTALNLAGERKVERFGWTFAPGAKVMRIKRDYDKDVYNGDIGYVEDVDPEAGELTVSFDGRSVTYGFGELDALVPAYAATIHKGQGSEYPAVVIPVLTQRYAM